MQAKMKGKLLHSVCLLIVSAMLALAPAPVLAAGYDNALKGVQKYDALYEFSQGDPKIANVVFWAIRDSYQVDEVKNLKGKPNVVVVFHGPVVKLISSNRAPFNDAEWAEVEKLQGTIREMKKEGVRFEVCQYAVKVMGVDEATIMPEIDLVGNGFVSVIGYQMQGYAVVRVP